MNPEIDANLNGSPMEQAIRQQDMDVEFANQNRYLSCGKQITSGGGRTLNIPKLLPPNQVPGPSYNGAVTIGEACQGGHCSIPVTPLDSNLIHNNLLSANPPPGANINYPGVNRLGNNHLEMPGIHAYVGTEENPGPFNIQCGAGNSKFKYITHPLTNKQYPIHSSRGWKILTRYLETLYSNS